MVTQLCMYFGPPPPPCAFGETGDGWPGPHHCHQCAARVEEATLFCAAEIAAGRYDENLYTPNEAKAARKHGTYRSIHG
jgi:hypothetical protein